MAKRKISKVGLVGGKIDWDGPDSWINQIVAFWAERRFHGKFIAKQTGLTVGQVYERCRRYRISLRGARDGNGPDSKAVVAQYGLRNIETVTKRQIARKYPNPDEA